MLLTALRAAADAERSSFPICDDFIISPEGTFIAE
jgi:hypothetical protein